MSRFILSISLFLAGCYDKEPPAVSESTSSMSTDSADTNDNDGDGYSESTGDCNDIDPNTHPGAEELCDKIDNDCNGTIDDNIDESEGTIVFRDDDKDGYGDTNHPEIVCEYRLDDPILARISINDRDCDDGNALIHPGAAEVCDEVDNNCDGGVDEDPIDGVRLYADNDFDGYGDGPSTGRLCTETEPEAGQSLVSTDCDDSDPNTHPGADEYCNERDNDCDGYIDNNALDQSEWFFDGDEDGYGAVGISAGLHCALEGWVTNEDDCNDADASVHPDAEEICDGVDNNCNGGLDEDLTTTYYLDLDGDDYGDSENPSKHCTDPGEGYANNDTDCNDSDGTIHPGASDAPGDEIDQNCDGTELCFVDADNDGITSDPPEILISDDALCSGDGEALSTAPTGDCDDSDPTSTVTADDADCDGILTLEDCDDSDSDSTAIADDTDCDGILTDDDCDDFDATSTAIADDNDCDGTLTDDDCDDDDSSSTIIADDNDCDGFLTAEDCNDEDAAINPDAYDVLDDGTDNNCDGGDWKTCDEEFIIEGSDSTINITALEFCAVVTGSIYLYDTPLTDTTGLSRLRTVGGYLQIENNSAMTTIALPNLTAVEGDFGVFDNPLLTDLTADSMSSIGEYLEIAVNDSLSALSFDALEMVPEIEIYDNPSLCQSVPDALEAELLDRSWPGVFTAFDNDEDC